MRRFFQMLCMFCCVYDLVHAASLMRATGRCAQQMRKQMRQCVALSTSAQFELTVDKRARLQLQDEKFDSQQVFAGQVVFFETKLDANLLREVPCIRDLTLTPLLRPEETSLNVGLLEPALNNVSGGKQRYFKRLLKESPDLLKEMPEFGGLFESHRLSPEAELAIYELLSDSQNENAQDLTANRLESKQVRLETPLPKIIEIFDLCCKYEPDVVTIGTREGAPEACVVETVCSRQFKGTGKQTGGNTISGRKRMRKYQEVVKPSLDTGSFGSGVTFCRADHETTGGYKKRELKCKIVGNANEARWGSPTIKPSVTMNCSGSNGFEESVVPVICSDMSLERQEKAFKQAQVMNEVDAILAQDGFSDKVSHKIVVVRNSRTVCIEDTSRFNEVYRDKVLPYLREKRQAELAESKQQLKNERIYLEEKSAKKRLDERTKLLREVLAFLNTKS